MDIFPFLKTIIEYNNLKYKDNTRLQNAASAKVQKKKKKNL